MSDLILLFNHTLTVEQKKDAQKSLGVEHFICMPENIRNIWGQIPPGLARIGDYLQPVRQWMASVVKAGDYLLIQGDFGATCLMVSHARGLNGIPVYATTTRESVEEPQPDGSVKVQHFFRHHLFRCYGE